jgi:2-polyprenyl-6-methoxyphenol hydroxylase-like FAD-dependent oxidoreductase
MHSPQLIVCDGYGPAASMLGDLDEAGVQVTALDSKQYADACGRLVDVVTEDTLRHLGSLDLWNAIRGAKTRPLSDRWAWSRKNSTVDISPLVAATIALWAAMGQPDDTDDDRWRIY